VSPAGALGNHSGLCRTVRVATGRSGAPLEAIYFSVSFITVPTPTIYVGAIRLKRRVSIIDRRRICQNESRTWVADRLAQIARSFPARSRADAHIAMGSGNRAAQDVHLASHGQKSGQVGNGRRKPLNRCRTRVNFPKSFDYLPP